MTSEIGQIQHALLEGYAITPRAAGAPQDPQYLETVRKMVVEAVYQVWNTKHRSTSLVEIYQLVLIKITDKIPTAAGLPWKAGHWKVPSKRTVDRRVNEAADPRIYPGGVTPIIALQPGVYMPNPQHFDGQTKHELEEFLK